MKETPQFKLRLRKPILSRILLLILFLAVVIGFVYVSRSFSVTENQPFSSHPAPGYGHSSARPRRRVYLDLGANWGQTLDLHEKLARASGIVDHDKVRALSWEVYSFEASPWIQVFDEQLVEYKNGYSKVKPLLPFPDSGSSLDLRRFAAKAGCPKDPVNSMRTCMLNRYSEKLEKLSPNSALNDTSLIHRRLDLGSHPNSGEKTRYTFIPAAVAASNGVMPVKQSYLQLLIGGVPSFEMKGLPTAIDADRYFPLVYVATVDIVDWLLKHFTPEDLVIIKMDVEGAEFAIVPELIRRKADKLVDVLAWECHNGKGGSCAELKDMISATSIRLLNERADYNGWR